MNTLRRTMVIFSMVASLVTLAWADVPEGKKVARKASAIQAQLEQVEKELVVAEQNHEEYLLRLKRQLRGCGNDLLVIGQALEKARQRLKELEGAHAEAAKVEAAKTEVARYEGGIRELLAGESIPDPINVERAPEVMNAMRRKIADLLALRDKLKEELRERSVPAKKAP